MAPIHTSGLYAVTRRLKAHGTKQINTQTILATIVVSNVLALQVMFVVVSLRLKKNAPLMSHCLRLAMACRVLDVPEDALDRVECVVKH